MKFSKFYVAIKKPPHVMRDGSGARYFNYSFTMSLLKSLFELSSKAFRK